MPAQVVVQRDRIELGIDAAAGQQRRQGRGEAQRIRGLGQIQRLDPEPVADQQQPARAVLVDREREHPGKAPHAVTAPLVVGLEDHLGVAGGEEAVPVAFELAAQLVVVVDAAVEPDRQTELGIGHRLVPAARQVDDLQPAMRERDARL
jgi:hypothetical protein